MENCLIFSRETFYVTITVCLNILWLKAIDEITARQIRTSLRNHDVVKLCSVEYINHTNRITVANFHVRDRSRNYRIFNFRTIVQPLKYLSHYNRLRFRPTLYVHRSSGRDRWRCIVARQLGHERVFSSNNSRSLVMLLTQEYASAHRRLHGNRQISAAAAVIALQQRSGQQVNIEVTGRQSRRVGRYYLAYHDTIITLDNRHIRVISSRVITHTLAASTALSARQRSGVRLSVFICPVYLLTLVGL